MDDSVKYLTTEDIKRVTCGIAKLVQNEVYQEEIGDLKNQKQIQDEQILIEGMSVGVPTSKNFTR